MIKKYVDYLRDNPKGYWFKRKLYGWGWTPATWQGWAVTGVYVLAVFAFAMTIDGNSSNQEVVFTFLLPLVLLTLAFFRVAYRKGESPRWQWGNKK